MLFLFFGDLFAFSFHQRKLVLHGCYGTLKPCCLVARAGDAFTYLRESLIRKLRNETGHKGRFGGNELIFFETLLLLQIILHIARFLIITLTVGVPFHILSI